MSSEKCLGIFISYLRSAVCNRVIPSVRLWHSWLALGYMGAPCVYTWPLPASLPKKTRKVRVVRIRDTEESRSISIGTFLGADTGLVVAVLTLAPIVPVTAPSQGLQPTSL